MATCDLGAYWRTRLGGRDFRLRAVAREPRAAAIPAAEEEVRRRRGDVLDFRMFSNLSLNLLVELPGAEVGALADALAARGWHVELEPGPGALAARADGRVEGTFQVTFPEGDGELAVPTPAVPG